MVANFKTPDVRQIVEDDLASADFPSGRQQDYRVYLSEDVYTEVRRHATEDTSVEICGVLVGQWQRDSDGPYAAITEMIRAKAATSRIAEVTLAHESWAEINEVMDTRLSNFSIVGWYHSHPGFGIFLSERDVFIHQHFFSSPGQVAYVVDPIHDDEGMFVSRNAKPSRLAHYWAGDRVIAHPLSSEDTRVNHQANSGANRGSHRKAISAATSPDETRPISYLMRWLPVIVPFLVGFLIADMRSSRQRQHDQLQSLAYYGHWKVLRPGLGDALHELDPQPLVIRVIFSSWFYLAASSGLGAFVAWMLLEPFFTDADVANEIEDCNTPDGTYVNGIPIQRQMLQAGDQIVLGTTVLEFEIKDSK